MTQEHNAYRKLAGDEMGLGKPWEPKREGDINEIFLFKITKLRLWLNL